MMTEVMRMEMEIFKEMMMMNIYDFDQKLFLEQG
jgi:hypothetical protein